MDAVQSLMDLTPSFLISKADVERFLNFQGFATGKNDGFRERVREFKRTLVIEALDNAGRNVTEAARLLSLDPSNLRKLLKSFSLQ